MLGVGLGVTAIQQVFNAGGGGDTGDWPLVLDFENGSYTSANDTFALADVWVPDTDWGNGGSLANVQNGVGLVNTGSSSQDFHFADTFAELVTAGPIVVLDFTLDGNPNSGVYLVYYETESLNWSDNDFQVTNSPAPSNFLRDSAGTKVELPQLANGDHKLALLLNPTRYAISIDGNPVVAFDNPVLGENPFPRLMVSLQNSDGTSVLHSATFRDPAEGEAALPALSA
jgi:hypothetical protein